VLSGVPTTFKVAALDYVSIMVGTTNAPATVKGYISTTMSALIIYHTDRGVFRSYRAYA
jgi:hypothetical protein